MGRHRKKPLHERVASVIRELSRWMRMRGR